MKKLLIIGTGGHSKVILDCALLQEAYSEIDFLAEDNQVVQITGHSVFYASEVTVAAEPELPLTFLKEYSEVAIAIGNNKIRLDKAKLFLSHGVKPATLIHPRAFVSNFAEIGTGTVIFANAAVNPFARIGIACIINTGATVEHECVIGDGVHISPNVGVAGTVTVGEKSWICIGSNITNNVNIGANSIVGAGSVVLSDVPDNVLAAGIPAEVKKRLA